jgi:hypothetical protein
MLNYQRVKSMGKPWENIENHGIASNMMKKPWKTTPVENIKKDGNPSFLLLRAEFSLH